VEKRCDIIDPPPAGLKRCRKCGTTKPLDQFYRDRSLPDGHKNVCKPCVLTRLSLWRRANLNHVRRLNRRAARRIRGYYVAYAKRPEVRRKAAIRQMANLAVLAGIIPRKHLCEHCGASDKVAKLQRHHPDYSRPLDVIWLCTLCHGVVHRKKP
jgi:hypothetical protein